MGLQSLIARLQNRATDTSDTPEISGGVSAKLVPVLGCTPDTLDTSEFAKRRVTNDSAVDPQCSAFVREAGDPEAVHYAHQAAATRAEKLAGQLNVSVAEPIPETPKSTPTFPMTAEEETAIRGWLAHIDETDPVIIAEVLDKCRADANDRGCLLRWAEDIPLVVVFDDRRRCDQCANLTGRGLCLAARRGEIVASRTYEPVRDLLQRCVGYLPEATETDQRPGRERWPGLIEKGGNDANA